MRLSLNQRGASQILLPLFLFAAIALGVYLAQQPTDITPSAQIVSEAPSGCRKVTPGTRSVQYKACQDASQNCGAVTPLTASQGEQDVDPNYKFPPSTGVLVGGYPLKESVWDFGGWKLYNMKGPRQSDGERTTVSKGRFDSPNGNKSYEEIDDDRVGEGIYRLKYREKGGQGIVVEYVYMMKGSNLVNYQGLPTSEKYDPSRSYAFVPNDSNLSAKCDGTGSSGSKNNGASCSNNNASECKSGRCSNSRCVQGTKKGGDSCTNREECASDECSNGKCEGGSRSTGSACDNDDDCASNRCNNNRCVSAVSPSPTRTPSPTPRSSSSSGGGGGGGGSTTSPSPSASVAASPAASTSPSPSASGAASPSPSGSGTTQVPTSLTKAEITGFKSSFDALYARLGTTKDTGNLKVVSTIANNELTSITSELNTCPDDANVGACLQKFRVRFNLAKTAARLTAFYAIFNSVSGICVKSDFGINPLITATSSNNAQGRVNLCTEPTAAQKIWRIFINGKFEPIISTDTRWPNNPTCANLPQDVMTHYRNAETLFNTQAGFIKDTACDGKTTFEAPGGVLTP